MNRVSFITLNKTRLFTAEQVCDIVEEEQERVLKELWGFCLINGAEQHGDLLALPKDPFFPLKLIKKIAEMYFESPRSSSAPTEPQTDRHVGHLSDAGINPVIIDDSFREKKQ